jgi:ammonium transporter, Amt family
MFYGANFMEWYFFGYALTFTQGSLWFGSDIQATLLRGSLNKAITVGKEDSGRLIPEISFIIFQGMFASFT